SSVSPSRRQQTTASSAGKQEQTQGYTPDLPQKTKKFPLILVLIIIIPVLGFIIWYLTSGAAFNAEKKESLFTMPEQKNLSGKQPASPGQTAGQKNKPPASESITKKKNKNKQTLTTAPKSRAAAPEAATPASPEKSVSYKTVKMELFKSSFARLASKIFDRADYWPYLYFANQEHTAVKSPDKIFFRPGIRLAVDKTPDLGRLYYKLYLYYKNNKNSVPYKKQAYYARRKEMIRKAFYYNKKYLLKHKKNLTAAEQKYLSILAK
ncbi:MAG TPA: hypothetical protein VKS21_04785, partial [Spirochaetota bacterium]|nr:hypothetical protein [Spirochaetota bacterium]